MQRSGGHLPTGNVSTRHGTEVLCRSSKWFNSQLLRFFPLWFNEFARGGILCLAQPENINPPVLSATDEDIKDHCTSETLPFMNVTFMSL
jgi:hypothetical protein